MWCKYCGIKLTYDNAANKHLCIECKTKESEEVNLHCNEVSEEISFYHKGE